MQANASRYMVVCAEIHNGGLSVGMVYEYAFARPDIAQQMEKTVEVVLQRGVLPQNPGGHATTVMLTKEICAAYESPD